MEIRIRYRIRTRRRRNTIGRRCQGILKRQDTKWAVLVIAFMIGAFLNGKTQSDTAYADTVIITGIPEPSTVSLIVCSAGFIFFALRSRKYE